MLLVLLGVTAWMVVLADVRAGSGTPAEPGSVEMGSPATGLVAVVNPEDPAALAEPGKVPDAGSEPVDGAIPVPVVSHGDAFGADPTAGDYFGGISPPVMPPDAAELLDGRSVDLVGDSLGVSFSDELRGSLPGVELRIDAEVGRPLSLALSPLRSVGRSDPDIVVVEIGTNDWGVPAGYEDQVRRALDSVAGASCVVWVNAQEFRPGLVTVNDTIDRVVADLAASRPSLSISVARWSDIADPPELHGSDGYHLSAQGQRLMTDLIVATVIDTCLG